MSSVKSVLKIIYQLFSNAKKQVQPIQHIILVIEPDANV